MTQDNSPTLGENTVSCAFTEQEYHIIVFGLKCAVLAHDETSNFTLHEVKAIADKLSVVAKQFPH